MASSVVIRCHWYAWSFLIYGSEYHQRWEKSALVIMFRFPHHLPFLCHATYSDDHWRHDHSSENSDLIHDMSIYNKRRCLLDFFMPQWISIHIIEIARFFSFIFKYQATLFFFKEICKGNSRQRVKGGECGKQSPWWSELQPCIQLGVESDDVDDVEKPGDGDECQSFRR